MTSSLEGGEQTIFHFLNKWFLKRPVHLLFIQMQRILQIGGIGCNLPPPKGQWGGWGVRSS